MKKETSGKKSLLWLWITIAVVIVAAVAVTLVLVLGGQGEKAEKKIFSEIYWNVDREEFVDEETLMTTREAEQDGLYYIRFSVGGEQVELTVADGKLVNKIDLYDALCLEFDADGVIVDAFSADEVYTLIAEQVVVQNQNGETYLMNSSEAFNGLETTLTIGEDVGVYNVVPSNPEIPGRLFKTGELDEMEIMDTVTVYGTDEETPTDIFITGRPYASKVYWRVDRQYNSTTKSSTRQQAEDGYWYIDYAVDGKIETHRTKSRNLINVLDGYQVTNCCCTLVFNHEGDIIDVYSGAYAIRGKVAAVSYNVSELSADGKTFTATRLMSGKEAGRTYSGVIGEDTKVYNVTSTADQFGEETTLQEGDLLYILTDPMGNAKVIYVINRFVDSPMYYNVSRKYSSALKSTTRTPDADGWYTIELAVKGQLKKFRCRDKAVVDQIDAFGNQCFGLKISGDVILKAYEPQCVSGNWSFGAKYFVSAADGVILSCESSTGTYANGIIADGCEIYDVSGHGAYKGVPTTLREGDRIVAYKNPQGEVTHVYVIGRYEAGTAMYYNVNRKYSGGQTSRTPDEDGYYVFEMVKLGSTGTVTIKTKDKDIATAIDAKNTPNAMALRVSNGIATAVYPVSAAIEGYSHLAGIHVNSYNETTKLYDCAYRSTGAAASISVGDAKIYNCSGVYASAIGERTTLRAGDRISCVYNRYGKIDTIIVFERESGSDAYWLKNPQYNSTTGETTRVPAEDGYYYFEVAVNGTVKTVKTKDKDIASQLDSKSLAFGLKLDGDVVKAVYSANTTKQIYQSAYSYYEVTAISGSSVTLERLTPGSSNTGDKQVINISAAKVYEVSQYADADKWGKATTLKVGDTVQVYKGDDNAISLVYVCYANTHEAGAISYCEHCGKDVFWIPYRGSVANADAHYYLTHDYVATYSKGWGLSDGSKTYDYVLDMNGHSYTTTASRAFAVRGGSTMTILDTTGKGGLITAEGPTVKEGADSAAAGVILLQTGATLNLHDCTITLNSSHTTSSVWQGGAIRNTGATLNIHDGTKIINNVLCTTEKRALGQGGGIWNSGTVNMYGGLIADNGTLCSLHNHMKNTMGGNVFNYAGGTFNLYGGTISGGSVSSNGGNFFNAGTLNVCGGEIIGGVTKSGNGGNIYVYPYEDVIPEVNISGGKISGGMSKGSDENIFVKADSKAILNLTGGTVEGDVIVSAGNTVKISGKPVVNLGKTNGLYMAKGVLASVGTMQNGAKVTITSSGIFTKDFASEAAADAMLAKKYFVGANDQTPVSREGKALACGKKMCINGHTTEAECTAANCDKELLYWNAWVSGDSLPTAGYYYLTNDVTVSNTTIIGGDLVLNLNGCNVTRTVTESQITQKEKTYIYQATKDLKLTVIDPTDNPGTMKVVQPKDADQNIIPVTGTYGVFFLETGGEMEILGGIFDGREMITSTASTSGVICGGGKLTINGGTFYGWSGKDGATSGGAIGSVFGGWSTSELTVNGGTFYGGKVYMGGMFATTGKIVINDGVFNGNVGADRNVIDENLPKTEAVHGGLIYMADNANSSLQINGGTFTAPYTWNAGGIIYTAAGKNTVSVNGGTYNLSQAMNGGFIRFRGTALEIQGVTLNGGSATTGDIIAFNSTGTLTIGKDAVIDGGIEMVSAGTVVLKDNVKIGAGTNYAIKLGSATLDISGLNDQAQVYVTYTDITKAFAEAADEATAAKLVEDEIILSSDGNYTVYADGKALKVTDQVLWKNWKYEDSLPTSGKYRLTKHVTVTEAYVTNGDLELDLNGFSITRTVTEQQITGNEATYIYKASKDAKLTITDSSVQDAEDVPGTVKVVLPKDADQKIIPVTAAYGIFFLETGGEMEIYNGIFDGREMITATTSTSGLICGGGKLTVHDGVFYGWSAQNGTASGGALGSVFGGWSSSELTVNGGTFYGGKVYQGGMFTSSGKIHITGGTFNGNNSASNATIDADLPRTEVTHGGLIYMQSNSKAQLIIEGGNFTAARCYNSGGIIYTASPNNTVTITGGTYALSTAQNGGFIRFRGSALTIEGVTLTGGSATTGDIIAFNSTGTLTIGKDAVIDGGIEMVSAGTVVLKDNVQIGAGTNYGIKLIAGATLDISALNDDAKVNVTYTDTTKAFAEAADEATAAKLVESKIVVSADPNYRVYAEGKELKVKTQIIWTDWISGTTLPSETGNYRLTQNVIVTATTTVAADQDVKLNLNGCTVTRDIKTADAAAAEIYKVEANGKLYITDEIQLDDPTKAVGGMVLTSADSVAVSGSCGIINVASGCEIVIENGLFDGRNVQFSGTSTHGLFCGSGTLTINGGTFYGMSGTGGFSAGGDGSIFGGWSSSKLYINGGTFYGGQVKQGGMFTSSGLIHITGGTFNGNNSYNNATIDSTQPRTYATHGGLIYMQSNTNSKLIIEGGTFIAARCGSSGGMIYTASSNNTVEITGGTFQLSKAGNGGFIRFRGTSLTIKNVTLTGATADTGNIIAFNSAGTLTIGKDAVINGGIQVIGTANKTKVVLQDNAQVNYADTSSYSLRLQNTTVHIGDASVTAAVTVGSTATDYVATYDADGNVTGISN